MFAIQFMARCGWHVTRNELPWDSLGRTSYPRMAQDHSISTESTPASLPSEDAQASVSGQIECLTLDGNLSEDRALSLLKRPELPADAIERLSKSGTLVKSRKVRLAIALHPKAPRHLTLPFLRQLFTFDLMQVALALTVPADIKRTAEDHLIDRLEAVSSGERLSLARRASGRVAGALLLDVEPRVLKAALENPRLTEAAVVKALSRSSASSTFVDAVCRHSKWSNRLEIRLALLRNEKTPLARALQFARSLPPNQVLEVLKQSRLPQNIREYLLRKFSGPQVID